MNYTLMHRKKAVAEIEVFEETAAILKVGEVFESSHFPFGLKSGGGRPDIKSLNDWWRGRSIPASRQDFKEAMETLGLAFSELLITKCFGLSLSDQYWVNPAGNPLEWERINFFNNPFSEDVGNILFGKTEQDRQINLVSPDNTSDGWLKKKWKIIGGKRCLIKGGSPPFYQEPLNEAFACALMKRLNIPCVPYSLIFDDGLPYSVCECFINSETELISAHYIINTQKKDNSVSSYQHFTDYCRTLGIPNARENIDKMLTLDYLIFNEDRHYNNFGAVRNAETLEWLGIAPIYDSGTSLWHNQVLFNPHILRKTKIKPFRSSHEEQIKLVKDFSWLNLADLTGIDEEFNEILRKSPFIDEARRGALCSELRKHAETLAEIIAPREYKTVN